MGFCKKIKYEENHEYLEAIQYAEKLVKEGRANGVLFFRIAEAYEMGLRFQKNVEKAIYFFQLSSEAGNEEAKKRLEELKAF